jgi:hypothetical protein
MNTYFLSLLQPVRKKSRMFVSRYNARLEFDDNHFEFKIETKDFEIQCHITSYLTWFSVDKNLWARYFYSKETLNLELQKINFRGKNTFLRLEEQVVHNLISTIFEQ